MVGHVLIDGNNLLHAIRESGALPAPGRETLVRQLERWAKQRFVGVTLFFDGAPPDGPMARQLASSIIDVRFSAPLTADDVIVELIQRESDAARLRVITDDRAIAHEARLRRCRHDSAARFIGELFPSGDAAPTTKPSQTISDSVPDGTSEWRRTFGGDEDEPFDGYEAMSH